MTLKLDLGLERSKKEALSFEEQLIEVLKLNIVFCSQYGLAFWWHSPSHATSVWPN